MKTSLENVFYREPKHKLRNKNISYLPLVTIGQTFLAAWSCRRFCQTFLLRNKIRNSEPRFDRKAKELQPQLGVKVPYKKNVYEVRP